MKNIFLLFILFIGLNSFTVAQKTPKPTPKKTTPTARTQPTKVSEKLPSNFFGELKDETYANNFFGIKVNFPKNWIINSKTENEKISQQGNKLIKSRYEKDQIQFNQAKNNVKILASGTKTAFGSESKASMICAVENMKDLPQITNSTEYLKTIITTFTLTQTKSTFFVSKEPKTVIISDTEMAFINVETPLGKQKILTFLRMGYGISFILDYENETDLKIMTEALEVSDFWYEN